MTRREVLLSVAGAVASRGVSYLRMDLRTGQVADGQWRDAHAAIAVGSLLKPFVALEYGAAHGYRFPEIVCQGCWKPDGHGRLALPEAIACSCNAYFLELARACSVDGMARVAAAYGLETPRSDRPESWIGLGGGWQVTPSSMVRAFAELVERQTEPGPAMVLRGMRLSARRGTAREMRLDAFAKTGTGPCTHSKSGSGDGFAVALVPAESPKTAWVVGLHDRPGAAAARVAGDLIRAAYTGN